MTWCPAVCQESGQREGEGLAEEGEEVACRRCDGSACQRGERGRLAWLLPGGRLFVALCDLGTTHGRSASVVAPPPPPAPAPPPAPPPPPSTAATLTELAAAPRSFLLAPAAGHRPPVVRPCPAGGSPEPPRPPPAEPLPPPVLRRPRPLLLRPPAIGSPGNPKP